DVAMRSGIGRYEHLARPKRIPTYVAHANAHREAHERRRVTWPVNIETRDPAPACAAVSPAPVVKGRKAPGRIIDPRPAPRADEYPMSKTIRRPTDLDCGHPN